MKNRFAWIFICAFVILTLCTPILSYGAMPINNEYLNPDNWADSSKYKSILLSKQSLGNELNGDFRYKIDEKNNILYTCFMVNETGLSENDKNVFINFDITNEDAKYMLSVGENGLTKDTKSMYDFFKISQNFATDISRHGTYICAVQINNSCDINSVEISLVINGHSYLIIRDMTVDASEKVDTKTTVKTTKSKVKKPQKTTKNHQSFKNTTRHNSTTKYLATTDNYTSKNTQISTEPLVNDNKPSTVIGVSVSVVLALIGCAFIVKSKKMKKE